MQKSILKRLKSIIQIHLKNTEKNNNNIKFTNKENPVMNYILIYKTPKSDVHGNVTQIPNEPNQRHKHKRMLFMRP